MAHCVAVRQQLFIAPQEAIGSPERDVFMAFHHCRICSESSIRQVAFDRRWVTLNADRDWCDGMGRRIRGACPLWLMNVEDWTSFFCSEFVIAALKVAEAVDPEVPSHSESLSIQIPLMIQSSFDR